MNLRLVSSVFLFTVVASLDTANGFQSFKLPNFFGNLLSSDNPSADVVSTQQKNDSFEQKKMELLDAISFTKNGKDATLQQQTRVLKMVRDIELSQPPSSTLLTNPEEAKALLDGTWYLQYTSPSEIDDDDGALLLLSEEDVWKVENAEDKITTQQSKMKGSVRAGGFTVDTSNRPVKQIIDTAQSIVTNEVQADFGFVTVGGPFRPSDEVSNRVVVGFTDGEIQFNFGLSVKLNWIFSLIAIIKQTNDNGWLEVTHVSDNLRIGRGNKGNMFILTRDPNSVQP